MKNNWSNSEAQKYIKKYKKLLDFFNTFLELSSIISNSPIWIENYDKRRPDVDLKLNYKDDFNLNIFIYYLDNFICYLRDWKA